MSLAFVCSISGFIYQFVVATYLATETGYVTEAHALTLAFFMAALGLGSSRTQNIGDSHVHGEFVKTEMAVILLASATYFILCGLSLSVASHHMSRFQMLLSGQILIFVFGFYVGRELPLILRLTTDDHKESTVVSLNYFGALAAALLTTNRFFSILSPGFALFFVSVFALIALFLVKAHFKYLLSSAMVLVMTNFAVAKIEDPYNRLYYFYTSSNVAVSSFSDSLKEAQENIDVWTTRSVYQRLDVVAANMLTLSENARPADRYWRFGLYLDRAKQISSENQDVYHELMAFVPINVTETRPRRILILGGGDGILAKTLLQKSYVESIDVVEIDEKVLDLASTVQFMVRLNEDSLVHPKVKVFTEDAFTYLYRERKRKKYDAVYMDFPYPRSDDHLKLYSVEIYKMVLDSLSSEGFFVFDFPFKRNMNSNDGILSTLREAGAQHIFAYGRVATFLTGRKSDMALNQEAAREGLSPQPLSYYEDLSRYVKTESQASGQPFNSILRPLWTLRRR